MCRTCCAGSVDDTEDSGFLLSDGADDDELAAGCHNESIDPEEQMAFDEDGAAEIKGLKAFASDRCCAFRWRS